MTRSGSTARAKIAVIPGDGIGPEVVAEGIKVLDRVGDQFGHRFDFACGSVGGEAIDKFGTALPDDRVVFVGGFDPDGDGALQSGVIFTPDPVGEE